MAQLPDRFIDAHTPAGWCTFLTGNKGKAIAVHDPSSYR